MTLHDAHNHLQDDALAPHLERIEAAWTDLAGPTGRMVVNGTHPDDWPRVAALAAKYPCVLPAYGLHPWDAGAPRAQDWLERLRALLVANPRASVGEIGLDRWILDTARPDDPRLAGVRRAPMEEQIAAFLPQLALAAELDRSASIHCLHAYPDLLPLLRTHPRPRRGFLLHAYSGPSDLIPELAALGAYFSFNPNFLANTTLPPAKCNQIGYTLPGTLNSRLANFRVIPADRLLCETDAPAMLPPQIWRTHKLPPAADGTPVNHPGNIEAAYSGLAALRGTETAALAECLASNFTRLFGP
ncbi:MAG: TatD family hydrolase [Verrucomicrobia bacterium]|nr:TatD family hydrolase [Verrucomicrobiota bacterium]